MKRLMFSWRLMDAAGGEGGGGGSGAAAPASGTGTGEPGAGDGKPAETAAAALATAKDDGQPGTGNGQPGTGTGEPGAGDGKPAETAAAALATAKDGEKPGAGSDDVDLAKTSDEDYAKLVMPDVDGEEVDRSLITPMAKELREAGIQPSVMAKVAAVYKRVVGEEVRKSEEERAARMKELSESCLREVTDDEKRDFAAAYEEYIAKDEALNNLVLHTELGSSTAFIRLAALAGAALRVEKSPRASAAGGTSQRDTDRGVFEATVPAHLR